MFRALATASTGMTAEQTRLDVTANNIANSSTTGFKRSRVEFADLMYQQMRPAGAPTGPAAASPIGTEVGLGVRVLATPREFSQGEMQQTGNPLDVAIEGRGFLPVVLPNGDPAYTRAGALQVDGDGRLLTADGFPLAGDVTIPAEASGIAIAPDGTITGMMPGDVAPATFGQLQLATFTNPAGLEPLGKTLYAETTSSGTAQVGPPGEGGAGTLLQGSLEASNVNTVKEMIDLIAGQRAYEINTRVIKAADEMLGQTAQLR
jgi:flagellar basal-body rod protein FlgG